MSIAVIGAGAIAEAYYFPILSSDRQLRDRVWLVEPSVHRRNAVAAANGFPSSQCVSSIEELPDTLTAAINATPSHLHVLTTAPLLARGVSMIVEKPLAECASDAQTLIDAAGNRCVLTVNQYCRLAPSYALVKEYISNGKLGEITSISWAEGHRFDWPTQSGFNFRRPWPNGKPRGALLDIGVHVFDVICWWLGEGLTVRQAVVDGYGGPEAFVTATLASSSATIEVAISFLEKLPNTYLVEGTAGSVRGRTTDFDSLEFKPSGGTWRRVSAPGSPDRKVIAKRFVTNFIDTVAGRARLLIEARSVVPALAAIDAIYENATTEMPRYYREWSA